MATPIGQLPRRHSPPPAHLPPRHDRRRLGALLLLGVVLIVAAVGVQQLFLDVDDAGGDDAIESPLAAPGDPATETTAPPAETEAQGPASGFDTPGLLTFRGSATRSYYGEGAVPADPEVLWSYPGESGGMCSESAVGDEVKTWCGSGWTGQPSVFERDGRTWVVFGAYDRKVHFVDYHTGEDIIPPFETGDIIKGSVTVDPDGLPLVYSGSRDNELHVIAIDRPTPTELWSLPADAVSPTKWNNDWDASPLVIDDYLYEGGENSQFHIVKLNKSTGDDGLVQVAPELVFNAPGWDDELIASLATRQNDVSIENSVAYADGVVYFANSGGLVQGWDVSGLAEGVTPTRVLRYWAGDDIDASIVIDDEGYLYVGVENERGNARAAEVGQLLKLDPRQPDDPLVWSVKDDYGFWTTPALHDDIVIAAADDGTVYAVDRQTGEVRWTFELPPPTWQSAVIVDDTLIQGDCEGGLHAYDVSDTSVAPPELWTVELEGCIESTPAVWQGRLFVGTRGGRFYAIGDP
ncbi:MAG: PQQ-binding-like beta-propeller repeat protein [Acidimicrobiales bacterium]|nr:PQQ-binding-like beta-propeller repeat protein [Acidimicrobiales bacterium]